jgi:hypothetical protein
MEALAFEQADEAELPVSCLLRPGDSQLVRFQNRLG